MKKILFIALYFISGLSFTKQDKPGFTITLNGHQFKNQTFFIPPINDSYSNNYFDFKADPKAKRTSLAGFKGDNSLRLYIDVPIHKTPGSFTFIEDEIPSYMGFSFTYEKAGSETSYLPLNVTVSISKYGKVGEFIEGTITGDLLRAGGSMNDKDRKVSIKGSFKVKRMKDRT